LRSEQSTPNDVQNIYVRSSRSGELIPLSSVITIRPFADSPSLNRYNRVRAITIDANLAPGTTLGAALTGMERVARDVLPEEASIDFKGQSLEFRNSGGSILFVFGLGLLIVFLVLAAQFESWVHPLVIILAVPATLAGGPYAGAWPMTSRQVALANRLRALLACHAAGHSRWRGVGPKQEIGPIQITAGGWLFQREPFRMSGSASRARSAKLASQCSPM
jgi:Cu/Ag efflux pump CusA